GACLRDAPPRRESRRVTPVAVPLTIARLNQGRLNACRLNWIGADITPPTVPSTLTATAQGGHAVALAWQASTDNYAVQGYRLERATGSGPWIGLVNVPAPGTSDTDATAKPSTTYRYRVQAFDWIPNYSAFSNIATATTADLVNIAIKVGGVWTSISQYARVSGAGMTQALNEVPDTLQLRIDGTCPYALKGAEIQWLDAENVLQFADPLPAVRTTYEGRAKNRVYECDGIDYTWLLNAKKITKRYRGFHVSIVLADLIDQNAGPGFTRAFAITNDIILDEITFTNEELPQAISRTCERAGLYWYVDYAKVIRCFNSTAIPSAGTLTQTDARQSVKLAKHEDYVPVATRILARGNGAGVSVDVAIGSPNPSSDAGRRSHGGRGGGGRGPHKITHFGV